MVIDIDVSLYACFVIFTTIIVVVATIVAIIISIRFWVVLFLLLLIIIVIAHWLYLRIYDYYWLLLILIDYWSPSGFPFIQLALRQPVQAWRLRSQALAKAARGAELLAKAAQRAWDQPGMLSFAGQLR